MEGGVAVPVSLVEEGKVELGPKSQGVGDQVDENPTHENNYSINHLPNYSGEYYHFFSFNSQI